MTRRRAAFIGLAVIALAAGVWGVSRMIDNAVAPAGTADTAATSTPPPAQPTAHITATLFYAAADGQSLAAVRREVPLADGVVAQGRQILLAQLEPAPMPYISTLPKGTMLRAFYVTDRGDAFIDVSSEISSAHPGGTLNELLTVDTLVDAVTANLPAVHRVQILVNGKQVETIAGHVDVRRPLERDMTLVK